MCSLRRIKKHVGLCAMCMMVQCNTWFATASLLRTLPSMSPQLPHSSSIGLTEQYHSDQDGVAPVGFGC